jgi:hypothetical protein
LITLPLSSLTSTLTIATSTTAMLCGIASAVRSAAWPVAGTPGIAMATARIAARSTGFTEEGMAAILFDVCFMGKVPNDANTATRIQAR